MSGNKNPLEGKIGSQLKNNSQQVSKNDEEKVSQADLEAQAVKQAEEKAKADAEAKAKKEEEEKKQAELKAEKEKADAEEKAKNADPKGTDFDRLERPTDLMKENEIETFSFVFKPEAKIASYMSGEKRIVRGVDATMEKPFITANKKEAKLMDLSGYFNRI